MLGAIAGVALQVLITPGLHFFHASSSCLVPLSGLGGTPLYVWETLLTFLFVMVLYAAIFQPPGHGSVAPLAAGVALYAALSTGKSCQHTTPVLPSPATSCLHVFYLHVCQHVWLRMVCYDCSVAVPCLLDASDAKLYAPPCPLLLPIQVVCSLDTPP